MLFNCVLQDTVGCKGNLSQIHINQPTLINQICLRLGEQTAYIAYASPKYSETETKIDNIENWKANSGYSNFRHSPTSLIWKKAPIFGLTRKNMVSYIIDWFSIFKCSQCTLFSPCVLSCLSIHIYKMWLLASCNWINWNLTSREKLQFHL